MSHTLDPRIDRLTDFQLLQLVLYGEARGEPIEGQVGVACVIRNRLHSDKWFGGSLRQVLTKWAQFSCLWEELSGGVNFQFVTDYAGVLAREEALPLKQGWQQRQLRWVADGVLHDDIGDNTHGATHYFATYITRPNWAVAPAVRTGKLGRHEFWAGVE